MTASSTDDTCQALSVCRRLQIATYLLPCTKLKSKLFKNLNTKLDPLNLIEDKLGNSLELIPIGKAFLCRTWKAEASRPMINK